MKKKLIDVFKSSNFKISIVTLLTIFISGLTNNSVKLSEEDIKHLTDTSIISVLMFSLQIISKLYISFQERGFNYDFLKSSNFVSQLLVVISLLLGLYFEEQTVSLIISTITIILNIVFKISQPVKKRVNYGKQKD